MKEVIVISRKITLPGKRTKAYELLELTAIFGEFPTTLLPRLFDSESYTRKVVSSLKSGGLMKTYYADGLRGLRPTTTAKRLLLANNPERFFLCMSENADTNHVHGDTHRRERLHRIAEATLTMRNAGASIFRDEHPSIFSPTDKGGEPLQSSAFYSSFEMREYGEELFKTKGARFVGVLLTPQDVFVTYNLGNHLIRWGYRAEMRTKATISDILCHKKTPSEYDASSIKGLLLANSMELAIEILTKRTKHYFLLDGNYENFYFVTNDEKGELLLRFLCDSDLRNQLDELLASDLCPADHHYLVENDAMTEDGIPVLFAYTCDLYRIKNFNNGLVKHEIKGIIYCFDYQSEVLRECCSELVEFETLSYEKVKKSILFKHSIATFRNNLCFFSKIICWFYERQVAYLNVSVCIPMRHF